MTTRGSNFDSIWQDEKNVTLLKDMWAEKRSAAFIADKIGQGLSRSAVLGKARRLKLAVRRSGGQKATRPRLLGRRTAPQPELPSDGVDVTRLVGIMELRDGMCRWIDGEPKGVHGYCGKPTVDGTSWCKEHEKRVFYKPERTAV